MDFNEMKLSLEDKAAQVLVSFRFGKKEISDYCLAKGWGGIHLSIWDHTSMAESRLMIEDFRRRSKIPPFITADTETGLGVSVPDATSFTTLMGIGATGDVQLAAEMAKATALECAYVGVSWSYGPVADINTYAFNPSSNVRCYGVEPGVAAPFLSAHIKAYQENGLMATAKHFPGQGHSKMNSHYALEVIDRSVDEMERCELAAFAGAIGSGVDSIMTNHAIYPAYDKKHPASLSYEIVTKILRDKLKFKGLVITDCLQMQAIRDVYSVEESVVMSLQAGCDIVLTENDYERSLHAVVNAVRKGVISESMLDERVAKMLAMKRKYGLFEPLRKPELDMAAHLALSKASACKSVKLERDAAKLLPLNLAPEDMLLVIEPENPEKLDVGVDIKDYRLAESLAAHHGNVVGRKMLADRVDAAEADAMLELCGKAKVVIYDASFRLSSGQLGIFSDAHLEFLKQVKRVNPKLILMAINPFVISQIPFVDTVVVTYSKNRQVLERSGELLFKKG